MSVLNGAESKLSIFVFCAEGLLLCMGANTSVQLP